MVTAWGNEGVAWKRDNARNNARCTQTRNYARPGWTTSTCGQDSPWKSQNNREQRWMNKVRPWCGQPSDRGRLKNRTEQIPAFTYNWEMLHPRLCGLHFCVKFHFTARRYASAVYAVVVCLSVRRLSVCPSQAGIVPKWLNMGLRKQRRTTAHGF